MLYVGAIVAFIVLFKPEEPILVFGKRPKFYGHGPHEKTLHVRDTYPRYFPMHHSTFWNEITYIQLFKCNVITLALLSHPHIACKIR
jgi:hypothetical protein